MEELLKEYEISFLLKDAAVVSEIDKILSAEKAEIFHQEAIREVRLAYPVKNQRTGYFGFYHFRALPEAVKKISDLLRLQGNILRFLIINPPIVKKIRMPVQRPASAPPVPEEIAVPRGLSNEALEQKLEEILK